MSLLKIEYQTNKDAIKTKMHQGKTIRKDILDLRLKQTTKVTPTVVSLTINILNKVICLLK